MEERQLQELLKEMVAKRQLRTIMLSIYVNALLRGMNIQELYKYLSNDTIIIILYSIAKQYLDLHMECDLELDYLEEVLKEKGLEKDKVAILYKAAIEEKTLSSLKVFLEACKLIYNY